jgi:hypothetical protein
MRVGGEVESVCRRCGTVWHVVIAMADGRIANVECGDCGARHRYRSASAATPTKGASRTPSRVTRRVQKPLVEADLSRPCRPFRASDTYRVGDRIAHDRFGEGVVQEVRGPTKIEVLFESGARILVHGRGGSG